MSGYISDEMIRKIEIHIETTSDCIHNFGLHDYVIDLLHQDIDLLNEILAEAKGGWK